jgi:hypothetical protein
VDRGPHGFIVVNDGNQRRVRLDVYHEYDHSIGKKRTQLCPKRA